MLNMASIARAVLGMDPYGTLNQTTMTVAFMEFLESADSNAMKSLLLKHSFRDISPLWGEQAAVPTFKDNQSVIRRWPEFQQAMTQVEADWYYLSGHHGRQYMVDGEELSGREHFNQQEVAGFFNEPYHLGPWEHASQDDPDAGRSANDVFMKTSQDDWVYEPGPDDNPLFTSPHESCKGVFLVGCNGLAYRASREKWAEYFPNSLIIGAISREANSISKILKVVQEYGKDFLADPTDYDPEELIWKLNPRPTPLDVLAIIHSGTFYFPVFVSKRVQALSPEEPVLLEHTQ
ncbi:MAG: hypothetical protein HRF50_13735 [Phycisphaerae bacterium]|jgi:hypothetical protein